MPNYCKIRAIAGVLLLICTFYHNSQASAVLKSNYTATSLTSYPYYLYEDTKGSATIEWLLKYPHLLQKSTKVLPENDHRTSTYWVKFPIVDSSANEIRWFIELYNYRIDSLEIYLVHNDSIILRKRTGDHSNFREKEISHKNFAFEIPKIKNDTLYYFFKLRSSLRVDFFTVVKRSDYFIEYSNKEYYLLGILYGTLFMMLFYNIFYFITLRERLHFYYLCSIAGFIIYFMAKDGTGFQYLWSNYPQVNDNIPGIAICFSIINLLFFTRNIYRNDYFPRIYHTIMWVLIVLRIAYLAWGYTFISSFEPIMAIDIPVLIFITWIGVFNINKKDKGTYYFPVGVALFLLGFSTTALFELGIIGHQHFWIVLSGVYGSTAGIVAQIITFWGALSYLHRRTIVTQKLSEYKLLMKESELTYLQKYKSQLEESVEKATESIRKKNTIIHRTNQNLETFIYKSSHNLRSPLRTIMGLYELGKKENSLEKMRELLDYVNIATLKMDAELMVLSKAAAIGQREMVIENVNLTILLEKIFPYASIEFIPQDNNLFETKGDRWLMEEGLKNVSTIITKLAKESTAVPHITLENSQNIYTCTILFECKSMKQEYATTFFTPFHKDIGYLYELFEEPYLCQAIMDKLRGSISMNLETEGKVAIVIRSKA